MLILVSASSSSLTAGDGVTLTVSHGASPSEVRLDWTGAQPPYTVHRSPSPKDVADPGNALGQTAGTTWLDVPPAGKVFHYMIVGTCLPSAELCDGVDNDCDGYTDEGCGTACVVHGDCAPEEHCGAGAICLPDFTDGGACGQAAECLSSHCQNGFCCAAGDCCLLAADCPPGYTQPSACDAATTCQGTRAEAICSAAQCGSADVDDDSGCHGGVQSQDCGPYPAVFCTGQTAQPGDQASLCATSCTGDGGCDPSAHCDGSLCVLDLGLGAACDEASDCMTSQCVDGVCCSSSCTGSCRSCALAGSVGTCTNLPDGTDPGGECGAVSCAGYYWGWSGDSCLARANLSAAAATCGGDGACRTTSEECSASGPGSVTLTCHSQCQEPNLSTCTGNAGGFCNNVNPGNQTCGVGTCQVTVPQCVNGAPNSCVPGSPSAESCNDLDDNCDGTIDNGAFSDGKEPNNDCASIATLLGVGSNQTVTQDGLTIYGAGDLDFFVLTASETDSSCGCCDPFCTDEDYQLALTLTVPSGAGSYRLCAGASCASLTDCLEVAAGTTRTLVLTLDGSCFAIDSYTRFVRVDGDNPPGFECRPYSLSYRFTTGCF